MSGAVAAGTSSSFSAAATTTTRSNHRIKSSNHTPSNTFTSPPPPCQETTLLGLSLHEAKRGVSGSFLGAVGENKNAKRRLEITARTGRGVVI